MKFCMKIVVLDGYSINPGDLSWDALAALGSLEIYGRTSEDEFFERAAGAHILLIAKVPITPEALDRLPDLRYIGVLATGYNMVDVGAVRARGIVLTNVPSYGTMSVAQFAIALLLELCNRVGFHNEAVVTGEWYRSPDWTMPKTPLMELADKTMGIVGYGRIGRQTALIAEALGMRILPIDSGDPLEPLLEASDVVSLHCPLTPESQGMIHRGRIEQMKPSALLINTARGPLIVEQDLADALNSGRIAGAGLDVLSMEPPVQKNPLITAKNCIVTPHIAWATKEARERLLNVAIDNVRTFLAGCPQNIV
jgi:glycerate dehydrogenase